MILYIDTHDYEKIVLALIEGRVVVKKKIIKATARHSEKLLVGIKGILAPRQARSLRDLRAIIVVKGPGSFSSLRIGIVTANTLAWALKIPIYGVGTNQDLDWLAKNYQKLKKERLVVPFYGKEPNITVPH